jgi:2-C-methyl-D-erythritol 4-phosphate cytidylyltransferase/2-C-methyl-D-erythritol 2,4-cyclodiphosphate synthase
MDVTLILLAAGSSNRFGFPVKKQWLRVGDKPLWLAVANRFKTMNYFKKIIVVGSQNELPYMQQYETFTFVQGGKIRQESLFNALKEVKTKHIMVSDVARSCISTDLVQRLLEHKDQADVIVPFLKVSDTTLFNGQTIDRDALQKIQTPQLSLTSMAKLALNTSIEYTDESSAIVAYGGTRYLVEGEQNAHKLTYLSDITKLPCLQPPSTDTLSGNGFDVHPFEEGKPMVLGGVTIESDVGFKAHSDGDVAIHALIDALLGAIGGGDIGTLFPDSDEAFKNIDSKELLTHVVKQLHSYGFTIVNADLTIMAQKPRLEAYKQPMKQTLASLLNLPPIRVNVKATTTEKLGFVGRKEGVAVLANANVKYYDWNNV